MKKILVPIDFSEITQSVCNYALNLVSGPSEFLLFHAYFDQVVVTDSSFPAGIDSETMINEQFLHNIKIRAQKDLVDLQSTVRSLASSKGLADLSVEVLMEGGQPENEIIRITEKYQPDFIIMGTSGGDKKGFLEGSIARKIMNQAEVPVFAIPHLEKYSWPNEVMYATEFSESDPAMIRKMITMLSFANPRVSCLHILQHEDFEEAEAKLEILRSEFIEEEREGRVQFFMQEEKDIKEDIATFLRSKDISLLAFIPHRRGIVKSLFTRKLTKKELFQFNLPLLAIK